jgi:hypothetical protein
MGRHTHSTMATIRFGSKVGSLAAQNLSALSRQETTEAVDATSGSLGGSNPCVLFSVCLAIATVLFF